MTASDTDAKTRAEDDTQQEPENLKGTMPVADWGTLYRPDPVHITEFLGADSHDGTQLHEEISETAGGLPAQGYVPYSNFNGEELEDDRHLRSLKAQLDVQSEATAKSPTQASAVSASTEERDYDPEEVAGDVIPDRDNPDVEVEPVPKRQEEPDRTEPEPDQEPVPEAQQDDDGLPPLP